MRRFMQTEMGNSGAQHFGYDKAFVPVEASRDFTVRQIEEATREKTSGKFVTIDESQDFIAW
jgi:norsolorinic acid ketoreductase